MSTPDPSAAAQPSPMCGLCRCRPAGAKAHIYPRALIRRLVDIEFDELRAIPSSPSDPEWVRRTGPWDRTILCSECEHRYQHYDDHAVKVLAPDPLPPVQLGQIQVIPGADAAKLKLFFMHVLWRAHASTLPEMRQVDIGPRAARLRELLIADDPAKATEFAVALVRFPPDPDEAHRVLYVFDENKWDNGARYLRTQIGPWCATITTSSLGPPRELLPCLLCPGQPAVVWGATQPYRESGMMRAMLRAVRERTEHEASKGRAKLKRPGP